MDIETREDIETMLRAFYEKVVVNAELGIIFTEIVPLDWEHHIPLITDFWETILLDHPVYKKNAMAIHYDINKKYPLEKKHFDAWLELFSTTIDERFSGKRAELAKKRARDIAGLMQFKMGNNRSIL